MRLKQKIFFDAGVQNTTDIYEKNDQPKSSFTSTPRSKYAIQETVILTFTNKIVGPTTKNLNISDGERRPGTK